MTPPTDGKPRVWAAMSGGVDSAAAAALLIRQGYQVEGIFMDLWDCRLTPSLGRASCCSPRDRADARNAADHLGIPLRVLDLQGPFRERVIDVFVESYRRGQTPNPCVLCNQWIKHGRLMEMALDAGAEYLATGHYAVNLWDPQEKAFRLMKATDRSKDQSYFLFAMGQRQLSRMLWPLGGLTKREVRALADAWGLPVAHKAESQEICFIPDGDYRAFLETYLPDEALEPGEIVDREGRRLGRHRGVHAFTVGQRRGLRVPWREPLYVLRILIEERRVVVGPREQLEAKCLNADRVLWVAGRQPSASFRALARIRYRHKEAQVFVQVLEGERIHVTFDEPQAAITPGQAVVLYRENEVLGGGWIREACDGPEG